MEWLRWYAGTVTDPKWRVVAAESGQPVALVLAVWAVMLERASASAERGSIAGWSDRVVGAGLDLPASAVQSIRDAMQGLVLDGDHLTGWEKRNPKREREDSSTERVRRYREKKKDARHVTPCNAVKRLEESREEEIEQKDDKSSLSSSAEPNVDRAGSDGVREVFEYWRVRCDHPQATLTQDRKAKIKARLRRYSVVELRRAIDHAAESPFYQGDNDRQTRYDYPETIFKTDAAAERLIHATNGNGGAKPKPVIVDD